MKFILVEQLTASVLDQFSRHIRSADECWSIEARNGNVALSVLQDPRWQTGTAPLYENAQVQLARWVRRVVAAQANAGRPISEVERALVAYGLEARLTFSAVARAIIAHIISTHPGRIGDLEVDLIADDPYIRSAFKDSRWLGSSFRAVRMHRMSGTRSFVVAARETLATQAWFRRAADCQALRRVCGFPRTVPIAKGGRRHAVAFVLNQRFLDLLQPVLAELEQRGWLVTVVYYNHLPKPHANALAFVESTGGISPAIPNRLSRPDWRISQELLNESPIPGKKLLLALNASWMTGAVQLHKHHGLLERLHPDVVISFGPEVMSLALQGAARSLGIPSLFMAHGFQGPVEASWFFHATASAMTSQACVEANQFDQTGEKRQGLVATGHPPYDAMLQGAMRRAQPVGHMPGLGQPSDRPFLVLLFAIWSRNLLGHALNHRTLAMVAEALPPDAFLICKLHPANEERSMCERVLRAHLPIHAFQVVGENEYTTPSLLAACHVAVANEYCMSLTDAIVMGVPAIAIRHPEFPRGCGPLNHPATEFKDICWVVGDVARLRKALTVLTREERERQDLLSHRKVYLDQFLVSSDGGATRRVADLIEHLTAGGRPAGFTPSVGASLLAEGRRVW